MSAAVGHRGASCTDCGDHAVAAQAGVAGQRRSAAAAVAAAAGGARATATAVASGRAPPPGEAHLED